MNDFISMETHSGDPIEMGEHLVIPFAQTLRIRFPGLNGGVIWNRPASVLARNSDGTEEVIPVPDVTRQIQWALLFASLTTTLFFWLLWRRK